MLESNLNHLKNWHIVTIDCDIEEGKVILGAVVGLGLGAECSLHLIRSILSAIDLTIEANHTISSVTSYLSEEVLNLPEMLLEECLEVVEVLVLANPPLARAKLVVELSILPGAHNGNIGPMNLLHHNDVEEVCQ